MLSFPEYILFINGTEKELRAKLEAEDNKIAIN